jgi:TPP-dependent pyruvate/acetoin dehydrogenase alpha subunit
MAEQVKGLVERERAAYQDFAKILDFTAETMCSNLGQEAVKASCKKLLDEIDKFVPLFRQRAILEIPDLKKEK